MKLRNFENLLDRHGLDPSGWPDRLQQPALDLLSTSSEARRLLADARTLARLIGGAMTTPQPPPATRLIERATSLPQCRSPSPRRVQPLPGWFSLQRVCAAAFATCLLVGVALGTVSGVASARERAAEASLYSLIDAPAVGPDTASAGYNLP